MTNEPEYTPEEMAQQHAEWQQRKLMGLLEDKRKAREKEGVIVNGVRYAGSKSNRQSLYEALQTAAEQGITIFAKWKDSDGNYHENHPVADVHAAYCEIGLRRMDLIAIEASYAEQIKQGLLIDFSDLEW